MPPLRTGQPVLVQDLRKTEWLRGKCQGQLSDRSYAVEVEGQLLHQNRGFLKPSVREEKYCETERDGDLRGLEKGGGERRFIRSSGWSEISLMDKANQ